MDHFFLVVNNQKLIVTMTKSLKFQQVFFFVFAKQACIIIVKMKKVPYGVYQDNTKK